MSTNIVGHNAIYTPANAGGSNIELGNQAVCPSDGTLTKISMYLDNTLGGSTQQITAAIWVDSAGKPGALVDYGTTQTLAIGAAAAWVDFPIVGGAAVVSGTTYWIGYTLVSGTTIRGHFQAGAATASYYKVGTATVPPQNPFGASPSANAQDMSAYATYNELIAPANTVAPAVTGTATVGSTLSCTTGTWTGSPTPTYTYQWQRGGVNIGSATASTYTLVDADDATNVRCVVTATNSVGNASANSNAVAITEPVPTISVAPAVTGTTGVGDTLTCTTGTWLNQGGTVHTYAYQWKRDGVNIAGQTAATHVIVSADQGTALICAVTATNTGGASTAADSNSTSIAAAGGTGPIVNPGLAAYIYTHRRR